MANNRLFIGHRKAKKYLMMSKGFGSGWNGIRNLRKLEDFIQDECIAESGINGITDLFLFTEYSPEYDLALKGWEEFDDKVER